MLRGLLLATAFLTRIPVRLPAGTGDADQGMAIALYPAVGLALGACVAALGAALAGLGTPSLVAAVVLVAAFTAVTGGLHLDGLADTADAWLGGHGDRERMLAIMKDPACGPAGVMVIVLALAAKIASAAALLDTGAGWAVLALAPMLARTACAWLFPLLAYVRPGGLGEAGAEHLRTGSLAATSGLALLLALVAGGTAGAVMAGVAAGVLVLGVAWMRRTLGGFTGDTAGALLECTEVAALVAGATVLGP
ncbi:adenosylcobinamide-GDP ribazoletransferase [Aquisalimonas lutea]|uniref:adenosylcobinamide-GDP ribazoletransferase n=1 Tax=Aquisalimonas lutea TaxID=1327750 RepID=UPI0025B32504|nr:adenosylcobinamide-GDP ribazoletransferase [Aquisalimonas lutea]MDN3516739.1 adenosylcobinamide-GDP ribazoletransferase [Aquisalimonas lutea]